MRTYSFEIWGRTGCLTDREMTEEEGFTTETAIQEYVRHLQYWAEEIPTLAAHFVIGEE